MTDIYNNDAIHGDEQLTEMEHYVAISKATDFIDQAKSNIEGFEADLILCEMFENQEIQKMLISMAQLDQSTAKQDSLRNSLALNIAKSINSHIVDLVKDGEI